MSRNEGERPPSVARTVREYIDGRPVVRDAIRMGIVNLSALTRRIQAETDLQQEEAILVACRRYQPDATVAGYEEGIRRVLDRSKLEVRTRVAVWTMRRSWRLYGRLEKALPPISQETPVHVLQGSEVVTLIADEDLDEAVRKALDEEDILKHRTGLVEVNLRTPARIEDVPGILAFLCSSLAARGINFIDVVSCHKDNMFIIEEEALFDAFEVLNSLIQA